jgi:hypothetical protein
MSSQHKIAFMARMYTIRNTGVSEKLPQFQGADVCEANKDKILQFRQNSFSHIHNCCLGKVRKGEGRGGEVSWGGMKENCPSA